MTNSEKRRRGLFPGGVPKYIRVYDNGGGHELFCRKCLEFRDERYATGPLCGCGNKLLPVTEKGTFDCYTVVFTGNYPNRNGLCQYLGLSRDPFHPLGFGQHCEDNHIIDQNLYGFAPKVGSSCHLGRRVTFAQLPAACQKLVQSDYRKLWRIEEREQGVLQPLDEDAKRK